VVGTQIASMDRMDTLFRRGLAIALLAVVPALGSLGCAADAEPAATGCKPDKQVYCRCANRASGSKTCQADRTYSECDCGGASPDDVGGSGLGAPEGDSEAPAPTPKDPTTPDPVDPADPSADPADPGADPAPAKPAPKCAKLESTAPKSAVVNVLDAPQKSIGGALRQGKYIQTWMIHFQGNDPQSVKTFDSSQTIEFDADFGRFTLDENGKEASAGFRYEVSGNKLTITPECPAGPERTLSYTTSGDQLVVFDGNWVRYFQLEGAAPVAPADPADPADPSAPVTP
jgi:hypothetical protein